MKIGNLSRIEPKVSEYYVNCNGTSLCIKIAPITDYAEFDKHCPEPNIPIAVYNDGRRENQPNDRAYLKKRDEWATRRMAYMAAKGLLATPEMNWETVLFDDPSTYENWADELLDFGLLDTQIKLIRLEVAKVNCITVDYQKEAKAAFLAQEQAEKLSHSQTEEPISIVSGGVANS